MRKGLEFQGSLPGHAPCDFLQLVRLYFLKGSALPTVLPLEGLHHVSLSG